MKLRYSRRIDADCLIVFKAPEDELDEHSTTAPLLAHADGELQPMSEEEREAVLDEGPNTGLKGTLMDGIANVSRVATCETTLPGRTDLE